MIGINYPRMIPSCSPRHDVGVPQFSIFPFTIKIRWPQDLTSTSVHIACLRELAICSPSRQWVRLITSPAQRLHLHEEARSMRPLFHHVVYNCSLFSKWHLLILSSIFTGSPSLLIYLRISPWSPHTALYSPFIKRLLPYHWKVQDLNFAYSL